MYVLFCLYICILYCEFTQIGTSLYSSFCKLMILLVLFHFLLNICLKKFIFIIKTTVKKNVGCPKAKLRDIYGTFYIDYRGIGLVF